MLPLTGEHQALFQQSAVVALLGQGHQLAATAQAAVEQHLDLKRGTPHIHGAINHEGAIRYKQHRRAFEGGVQHQIQQQLHAPLHPLTGAEFPVAAAPHVEPTQHGPPQAGVHRGDAPDGALAVIGHQLTVLLHKAGGEHAAGLIRAALQFQAGFQEVAHDGETSLHQEEQHHGHVVPQEHLVVVEGVILAAGVAEGCHRSHQLTTDADQGALKVLVGSAHHRFLAGAGAYS